MRGRPDVCLLAVLAVIVVAASAAAGEPPPAFRIYVPEPGVYRVSHEDLAAAGLPPQRLDSASLALTNQGEPVAVWMVDGGDGNFGPGDAFEFVGEVLKGDNAWFHEYSRWNVYRLSWNPTASRRMTTLPGTAQITPGPRKPSRRLRRHRHLEEDRLLIRLTGREGAGSDSPEPWFWAKLTHADGRPFTVPLELDGLATEAAERVSLKIHFRALSQPRTKPNGVADHQLEVSLNGSLIATAEWDGQTTYLLERELEVAACDRGTNRLELRVPRRVPAGETNPVVDVVMLNWIEVSYPHLGLVDQEQLRLEVSPPPAGGAVALVSPGAARLLAYDHRGVRTEALAADRRFLVPAAAAATSIDVVPDAAFKSPERIELDRPSALRAGPSADYLMIAHRRLLAAARPLAEFHRRRGLAVALVDVQDVYDEFNHGILHPRAIRDFIAYARRRGGGSAPRFALLVGDASWDTKNATVDDANYANWSDRGLVGRERFGVKPSAVYAESPELNRRNLIPTWNYSSSQGHAASDNYFVAVEGEDERPDLAIGRFPVIEPAEVTAIVDKTIRYAGAPELGPWRRNVLWVTDDREFSQGLSDELDAGLTRRGFASLKVYPQPEEAGNEHHQEHLRQAFDQGHLLVHFYGHGGRYIWRTGPPDFKKNHDLFTLEDLAELAPNRRLPVVLSMTCFTAPFDHPNADSISELFLRLPDRGAIAVVGASWRNVPLRRFSQLLVHHFTLPGTIGEAVLRAKRECLQPSMVATYNLLGDPAIPLPVPPLAVRLEPISGPAGPAVSAVVETAEFSGGAVVEWLDAMGEVVFGEEMTIAGPRFEAAFPGAPDEIAVIDAVRVYVWDPSRAIDGLGRTELREPAAVEPAGASP
ncbi:MAG: hypothetical protein GY856_47035 [bacterium]|nr:hypothetical protein [bacterium]